MMKYSIGFNNDIELIDKIYSFCIKNNINLKTVEFFSGYPKFKSSLNRFFDENIKEEKFINSITYLLEKGFEFNYLMNSKIIDLKLIDLELNYLNKIGIKNITISDINLIKYIDNSNYNFNIIVSIIYGVKNNFDILKLKKYKKIKRIIFDQSLNHNFKQLINIIKICKNYGIETEILANELCYSDCELRDEHYYQISKYNGVSCDFFDKIGNFCVEERKKISIINNSPWVRPEDIVIYNKLGIDYIKIAGRNTDTDLLYECSISYLRGYYIGNFFDLMDLDGKKGGGRNEIRKLKNKKLDGVIYNKFIKQLKGKD